MGILGGGHRDGTRSGTDVEVRSGVKDYHKREERLKVTFGVERTGWVTTSAGPLSETPRTDSVRRTTGNLLRSARDSTDFRRCSPIPLFSDGGHGKILTTNLVTGSAEERFHLWS